MGLRLATAVAPEQGLSLQLLVALAVIMVAEVLPSRFAERRSAFYAERVAPRLAKSLRPLAWLLHAGRGAPASEPRPAPSRDEELLLDSLIEATDDEGGEPVLDPTAHELLRRVVRLRDTRVRDAMTLRDRVPSLPHGATLEQAAACLSRTQSTRILVTGRSVDDVLGVLHLKDVFRERLKPPLGGTHAEIDGALAQIARPVSSVSVDDTLGEVLMAWRRDGRSMAVVESDDGRVIGFITYVDISRWLMRGLERPKALVQEKEQAS
jgi:putative hemolysin